MFLSAAWGCTVGTKVPVLHWGACQVQKVLLLGHAGLDLGDSMLWFPCNSALGRLLPHSAELAAEMTQFSHTKK